MTQEAGQLVMGKKEGLRAGKKGPPEASSLLVTNLLRREAERFETVERDRVQIGVTKEIKKKGNGTLLNRRRVRRGMKRGEESRDLVRSRKENGSGERSQGEGNNLEVTEKPLAKKKRKGERTTAV